jgi:D-alanyl-D-alanine carboxypeptidase
MRSGRAMRRARTTAAVAALVLLSACNGGDPEGREPTPGTSTSAAGTSTSAEPSLDAEHVMEPPGTRTGEVAPPDILVTFEETIDEKTIRTISRLEGVRSVETISRAQVIIENEALELAAVDPATYRNYTELTVAETQDIWERVAGGELALGKKQARRLPQDENGFLKLGAAEDAPSVHIGAYASQVEQIDAVLNQTWVETLGMTPDNALLVRTGRISPERLRKPIERLVGGSASVQMVDAVARYGLDPTVQQTAVLVGTVADVVGVFNYTVIGGGRIAPEASWVRSQIATKVVPILGSVTCNKYLFPQLEAALREIVERGLADEIHPEEYAGCYYPRFIAGTTKLSNHSFGLALDLNVPGNQRGTVGEMNRDVVAIFKKWGFAWGGDWAYTDPMHFEMNALVDPRVVGSSE